MLTLDATQLERMLDATTMRFADGIAASLATESLEVGALNPIERAHWLGLAVARARSAGIATIRDFRAFVRLCFLVGPTFAEYPAAAAAIRSGQQSGGNPIRRLFGAMTPALWAAASIYDVVARYRDPVSSPLDPENLLHVTLRPATSDDISTLETLQAHPDVRRLSGLSPVTATANEHAPHFGTIMQRTICEAEAGAVGALSLCVAPDAIHVAYWVARPFWGRGIATTALRALSAEARDRPLVAWVRPDNGPSAAVLEKAKFTAMAAAAQAGEYIRYQRA